MESLESGFYYVEEDLLDPPPSHHNWDCRIIVYARDSSDVIELVEFGAMTATGFKRAVRDGKIKVHRVVSPDDIPSDV